MITHLLKRLQMPYVCHSLALPKWSTPRINLVECQPSCDLGSGQGATCHTPALQHITRWLPTWRGRLISRPKPRAILGALCISGVRINTAILRAVVRSVHTFNSLPFLLQPRSSLAGSTSAKYSSAHAFQTLTFNFSNPLTAKRHISSPQSRMPVQPAV